MNKHLLFIATCFITHGLAIAQWNAVASMSTTRAGHAMSAYGQGHVLAAGGWDYTTNLKSAEFYDAGSNSWTSTPEMASEHYNGAAVTLNSGKVLVIAGYTGAFNTEACDVYDPTMNMWAATGELTQGRSYFTATKLQNGKVLVVGGFDGTNNLSSCELYDPATEGWTTIASLTTGRSYHTATLLSSGQVLITGGFNPNAGFQMNSTELFDPTTETWTTGPNMNIGRDFHAASILANGKVLVTGGRYFNGSLNFAYNGLTDTELYDPTTNSWSAASALPVGLSYHQQVTLGDGNVLVIAGVDSSNFTTGSGFTTFAASTYLYHSTMDMWVAASMNHDSRYEHSAVVMSDGNALVTGGFDASSEIYGTIAGLENPVNKSGISIYPNPGKGVIHVELSKNEQTIRVFDSLGKLINVPMEKTAQGYLLQTEGLNPGCYLVIAGNEKKSLVVMN
jgi:N-acetylneuraminic acid mutarotase